MQVIVPDVGCAVDFLCQFHLRAVPTVCVLVAELRIPPMLYPEIATLLKVRSVLAGADAELKCKCHDVVLVP